VVKNQGSDCYTIIPQGLGGSFFIWISELSSKKSKRYKKPPRPRAAPKAQWAEKDINAVLKDEAAWKLKLVMEAGCRMRFLVQTDIDMVETIALLLDKAEACSAALL
jgi:hypothetical protein